MVAYDRPVDLAPRAVSVVSRSLRLTLAVLGLLLALAAPAGAGTVPLTKTLYGSPAITEDRQGTQITISTPPGGLYYRATGLDPTRAYMVTVIGEKLGYPFTMRLRRNAEAPVYDSAPDGQRQIQVT